MKPALPKIGLALGSGGARGFAHLAVIRRLREWGVPVSCVAGTSIGAIIGAALAAGTAEQMEAYALGLDWKQAAKLFLEARLPNGGFLTGRNIMRELRRLIPCADFHELGLPFACVATDIRTGHPVVLDHGDLFGAIRASMSIPGVFTPVPAGDAALVDGGLVDALPVTACRHLGADIVIGVDINLKAGHPAAKTAPAAAKDLGLFDVMFRTFRLLENETTRLGLESDPPDILIQPAVGHINALDFLHGRDAYAAGLAAMDDARHLFPEIAP